MISWGLAGLDLSGFLGPVRLVCGTKQVRSMCARFCCRWDAFERWWILAIGVTPGSMRPLVTVGNLGVWSCLDIV
jgi:hypothetical protein